MRKLKRPFAIISSLLIVVSCSKEDSSATSADKWGTASFDCSMLSSVSCTTRSSDLYYIPEDLIPATGDIVLKITGSYIDSESSEPISYSYGPLALSTYNTSQPKMIASDDYNAQFSWGTAGVEGEAAPYFSGEVDFEVIARGDTTEEVSLVLRIPSVKHICCHNFNLIIFEPKDYGKIWITDTPSIFGGLQQ